MPKRRYEILVPLTHNDGQPVSPEKFQQTSEELIAQFGALSLFPEAVRGIWLHQGTRYENNSMRIIVDVDDSNENYLFFSQFKTTLIERFQQIDIYIVSYPLDIV